MTGTGPNPMDMLKQVQEMQASMQAAQDELANTTLDATVTGEGELTAIHIDPSVVDPDDVETLEDLVVAAVTEARREARELQARKLGAITGGLDLGSIGGIFGGPGGALEP